MLLVFMGCEKHNHNESSEHHEHHHIHSFVAYTDNMELFLQHEGLEAGKKSCITLYATSLDDFKPAESDKAELLLSVAGKRVSATANAMHKGVYHFDFAPEEAGHGVLYLDIAGEFWYCVSLPKEVATCEVS